jgi:hypothetical protein
MIEDPLSGSGRFAGAGTNVSRVRSESSARIRKVVRVRAPESRRGRSAGWRITRDERDTVLICVRRRAVAVRGEERGKIPAEV